MRTMVVHRYDFSMRRFLVVLLLSLPLYAETFEARSPHYAVLLERTSAGRADISVTEVDTNTVVLRTTMKGDHTATEKKGDTTVWLHADEKEGVLSAIVRIETKEQTIGLISGSWLVTPRPVVPVQADIAKTFGDVKPPTILRREPHYTDVARTDRVEGVVVIRAVIDKTGHVTDAQILKGLSDGLSEAAVDAVKQWTFAPGTLNGDPVDVFYNVTLVFRLK